MKKRLLIVLLISILISVGIRLAGILTDVIAITSALALYAAYLLSKKRKQGGKICEKKQSHKSSETETSGTPSQ